MVAGLFAIIVSQEPFSFAMIVDREMLLFASQACFIRKPLQLAEYHCHYDGRTHKVKDIRDGVFYATRFASPQGSLVPLTPQESLVLYRPRTMVRQAQLPFPAQQLWLFELVKMA